MNTVAQPAARPAFDAEFRGRLQDHARLRLAAIAIVDLPMETSLDRVYGQLARHLVHRVHFRPGGHAVSHVRLVGDY
jgi:hypothetical protein